MKLVIVTGMSGAGKTVALKMMEDMGYYCVDNLPISLIEKFAELALGNNQGLSNQVALGIDIRSGQELPLLDKILERWRTDGIPFEILFLDASDEVLLKRYKETRRNHPLTGAGRIDEGIKKERECLAFLKKQANVILDTSMLLTKELRQELEKIYMEDGTYDNLFVTVMSFGFKYGIPADADLVFDVRFLPNPFYIPELREHTGLETCVRDYAMDYAQSREFVKKLVDMMEYLIPHYEKEGKAQLVIGIGCTGGHHRSVTIAEELHKQLLRSGHHVLASHRDIQKGI